MPPRPLGVKGEEGSRRNLTDVFVYGPVRNILQGKVIPDRLLVEMQFHKRKPLQRVD